MAAPREKIDHERLWVMLGDDERADLLNRQRMANQAARDRALKALGMFSETGNAEPDTSARDKAMKLIAGEFDRGYGDAMDKHLDAARGAVRPDSYSPPRVGSSGEASNNGGSAGLSAAALRPIPKASDPSTEFHGTSYPDRRRLINKAKILMTPQEYEAGASAKVADRP